MKATTNKPGRGNCSINIHTVPLLRRGKNQYNDPIEDTWFNWMLNDAELFSIKKTNKFA